MEVTPCLRLANVLGLLPTCENLPSAKGRVD